MKKCPKHILFLALALLLAEAVKAQENPFGSAKHAVGFSAGGAMGAGLTYRVYSSGSFIQGSFFARANRREDINNFMIGASYGRKLSEISIVKALPPTALVFVAGLDGVYVKNQYDEDIVEQDSGNEKALHTGAGIALEIGNTFSPGLLFSIGTSYVLAIEQNDGKREWNLGPQVTVRMLYNW